MLARDDDPHDRILDDMIAMHDAQRTLYRRYLCSTALALVGAASCLIRRAMVPEDDSELVPVTAILATLAMALGLLDARQLRALNSRIQLVRRTLLRRR